METHPIALIVYHQNIHSLYPKQWLDKFCDSILNQTHKEFSIYEINYGGTAERLFERSDFESKELSSFADAMNYLIDKALSAGAKYIANSNCDDYFSYDRIEKQLFWLEQGYDVVSSNFVLIRNDQPVLLQKFDGLDLEEELYRGYTPQKPEEGHNIIAHPSVAYNRRFFEKCRYEPDEIPYEDLWLWRRALKEGMNFKIVPEVLLYHRLHDKMVSNKSNDRKQIV